jgi:exonuclease SbcC
MRPVKLTMQAFGSYGKKTVIDFRRINQNFFLIAGDTGAGKTTIFDALVFALYGEASSNANRKDGTELQSHYVEENVEPFVELTFTEGSGEEQREYTVRRVPRHFRPRKRGTGSKEESGRVSLLMPDGSEYPARETDRKLKEMVGLTKEQFMQVAMIAQGEFMELLRARSDDKKEIFRKLFHTEIYEQIVTELGRRRREKLQEIGQIRTVCQNETAHVFIPPEDAGAESLKELSGKIISSERLSVTDTENLLAELESLCGRMAEEEKEAEKISELASREHLEKRDAFTAGLELLKRFQEREQAEAELAECAKREADMIRLAELSRRIEEAWEVSTAYLRYADAGKSVSDTKKHLKDQEEAVPELEKTCREAEKQKGNAEAGFNQENEAWAKISERVKNARKLFAKIRQAEQESAGAEEALRRVQREEADAVKALQEQEREKKKREEEAGLLKPIPVRLERWKVRIEKAGEIGADMDDVRLLQKEAEDQKQAAEAARRAYAEASIDYREKRAEYEEKRQAFLNVQAGFIAREQLRPGMPCPVCGSLDHPHPCVLKEEHRELSRESLEALSRETEERRKKQDAAAEAAQAARIRQETTEKNFSSQAEKLKIRLKDCFPEIFPVQGEEELSQTEKRIRSLTEELREEGKQLEAAEKRRKRLEELQEEADREQKQISEKAEQAKAAVSAAETVLAASRASLDNLRASRDYDTEEAAEREQGEAGKRKEQAERALQAARAASQAAEAAHTSAIALIGRYRKELPKLEEERQKREEEYQAAMVRISFSEPEWKTLTEEYSRADAAGFRKQAEDWKQKKTAAESVRNAAVQATAGKSRPEPDARKAEADAAEKRAAGARERLELVRNGLQVNRQVLQRLQETMESRRKTAEEYSRLENLYGRLGGNVTGARMDIETFVQRRYLERILRAANRRFGEMSAGQFELRMSDLESAGKGRNRGLDLMVYSHVTGKEREVRTLSGGESFMAALSLALGLADQIQAGASSVHPDILFIDEGFGSLDEHSRDKAVRVLRNMAGESRLVGIISHVEELKQEMEDQLVVWKDENGSHVKWEIS